MSKEKIRMGSSILCIRRSPLWEENKQRVHSEINIDNKLNFKVLYYHYNYLLHNITASLDCLLELLENQLAQHLFRLMHISFARFGY
jgi:hypothetical protein